MKLLFSLDAFYNRQLKYKKGETYEIDNSLGEADRWIKRGVADVFVEKAEPVKSEPVKEELPVVEEPELAVVEETIVNIEDKKENGRGKKRKEKALNESSEIL